MVEGKVKEHVTESSWLKCKGCRWVTSCKKKYDEEARRDCIPEHGIL